MAGKKWLQKEVDFINENYKTMTCDEMGKVLNRTKKAVQQLSAKLKLNREAEIGEKFGRLTILEKLVENRYGQNITFVNCKCDCGKNSKQKLTAIVSGRIVSCGCWKAEKARERTIIRNKENGCDGRSKTRIYYIYYGIRERCLNPNSPEYHNYGGRGISICEEWLASFEAFRNWSFKNSYSDNLTIDRINVNGNYEPANCRWVTHKEQCHNRRCSYWRTFMIEAFGEIKSVIDWLEDERCGVKQVSSIIYRLGKRMSPEEAISKKSLNKI